MTTLSKDLMTWLVGPTNLKLILCQIWGLQVLRKDSYDIFHLSRDYVIKKSFDFEGGVPPPKVTTLPSLVAIGIAEGQI